MNETAAPAGAKALLRAEMDWQGVTDNDLRAGIMALCGGESDLRPRSESSYRGTSNIRIREVFGSRVRVMLDSELNALKADDEAFFNHVYGGEWGADNLGNTEPGDGYRFRGRGFLQLTGRDNYARYAKLTGHDLVGNPELANDQQAAAAIAVAYMRDRYKGGGWDAMKRAVGNSFGTVDERKNALYRQYSASGEFDYRPSVPGMILVDERGPEIISDSGIIPLRRAPIEAIKALQTTLRDDSTYRAEIDGAFGPKSRTALNDLLAAAGQPRL